MADLFLDSPEYNAHGTATEVTPLVTALSTRKGPPLADRAHMISWLWSNPRRIGVVDHQLPTSGICHHCLRELSLLVDRPCMVAWRWSDYSHLVPYSQGLWSE